MFPLVIFLLVVLFLPLLLPASFSALLFRLLLFRLLLLPPAFFLLLRLLLFLRVLLLRFLVYFLFLDANVSHTDIPWELNDMSLLVAFPIINALA